MEEAEAINAEILALLKDDNSFQTLLSLQGVGPLTAGPSGPPSVTPSLLDEEADLRYAGFDATVF
ncbi:MAG: hypothetical protein M0Z66_15125 [Thermaerobacter sp.]|nr:hypothetical protein [Thermaerobacter sp.]